GHEPPRDELGESLLDRRAQQARRVHEVPEERRAAGVERLEHGPGRVRQGELRRLGLGPQGPPHRSALPPEQRDGGGANRAGLVAVRRAGGRHAAPRDLTREAQPVEPQRIVLFEPGGQHVRFPRAGGDFVPIQQVQHRGQPPRSRTPSSRVHTCARSRSGGTTAGSVPTPGKTTASIGSRSAAIHNPGSVSSVPALPARTSSSKWGRQDPSPFPLPPSPAVNPPITSNASCSSSALETSGHASSLTRSIAAGSRVPSSSAVLTSSPRRVITAWVRRSSSGASSRKAYGLAFSTSCARG